MIALPHRLYSLVVGGLLVIVILAMIGDYVMAWVGHTPPPTEGNLAHAAIGGLIGLLVVPQASPDKAPTAQPAIPFTVPRPENPS